MSILLRQEIDRVKQHVEVLEAIDHQPRTLMLFVSQPPDAIYNTSDAVGSLQAAQRLLVQHLSSKTDPQYWYSVFVEREGGITGDFASRREDQPPTTIPWDSYVGLYLGSDWPEGGSHDLRRCFEHCRDTFLEIRKNAQ